MPSKNWTCAPYHRPCSPIFPCITTYNFGDVIETYEAANNGVEYYELCFYYKGNYAHNEIAPFIFDKKEDARSFAILQNQEFGLIFPWVIIGFHKDADEEIWNCLSNYGIKVIKFTEMINLFIINKPI